MLEKNIVNGIHGEMKPNYYKDMFDKGLEYQDFVTEQLYQIGIVAITYASKKYQFHKGESLNGIEIKFDDGMASGNLYIETQERIYADKPYIPSGIYRSDNSWLYVIGNYDIIYIFSKKQLQMVFENNKYPEIEIDKQTSKGFLLPQSYAKDRLAIRVIEIDKNG